MSLLEPHNLPFAIAAILLVFITIAQVIGAGDLFDGADADIDLDLDLDVDGPDGLAAGSGVEGALSLLGLGRVPILIWLMLLLLLFAGIGVATQELAQNLLGSPLHPALATLVAGVLALPVNGALTRPLARLLPQDETSAVDVRSLIKRDAVIQTGIAAAGSPARAKVLDRHGHPHFVMVEPHNPEDALAEGETVLLVRREEGTFYAMRYENPLLGLK